MSALLENEQPQASKQGKRPGRTLLTALIFLAFSVGAARCTTRIIERIAPNAWGNERTRQALSTVKQSRIVSKGKTTLAIGTSNTVEGLNPTIFDTELQKTFGIVTTWNYGINGPTAKELRLFVERLVENYSSPQVFLGLIEFSPELYAHTQQPEVEEYKIDQNESFLISAHELFTSGESLRRIARLATYKYLLASVSPVAITSWVQTNWQHWLPTRWTETNDPPIVATWKDWRARFALASPSWEPHWRGWIAETHGHIEKCAEPMRSVCERLATMQTFLEQQDLEWYTKSGLINLEFDDKLINEFILTVKAMNSIASHVVIVLMPKNPALIRPIAAELRLKNMIQHISEKTKTTIIDVSQSTEILHTDFYDINHLNGLTGEQKFAHLLGSRVRAYLQRTQ
jgi:hypothetical protein